MPGSLLGRMWALGAVAAAGSIGCRNATDELPRGCVELGSALVIQSGEGQARRAPLLFDIRGGAVLSDGRIVILNRGSKQLLYFTAYGRFLEAVGREGRGPGEFTDPRWLGHGGGDTVLVWDPALARLTTFEGSALLRGVVPRGPGAPGPATSIIGRFADGSFLTRPRGVAFFPSPNGVLRLPESYDRYDPASETVTHLHDGRSIEWAAGDRGRYTRPFGKEDIAAARGDRMVIGDNGTSDIRVYDLDGRLDRIVRLPSEVARVTEQDQSRYVEYMREEHPRFPLATELDYPDERPRFSTIIADELDWMWVESFAADWEPQGSWLLFDTSGALQCEVRFPDRIQILEIGKTYALAKRWEESGEQSVIKYTLLRN